MLRYSKRLALYLAVMLLASCQVSKESIPGHYHERFDWGEVSLELRKDGTFTEEAKLTDGTKRRIEGNWSYQVIDGDSRVERGPCLSLGYERLEKETYPVCGQSIEWTPVGIEIPLDPDHGYAYAKKGPTKSR